MSIADRFETSEHRKNIAHFAAIVNVAIIDGTLNANEITILKKFANKLDISPVEYKAILYQPEKYPLIPENSSLKRLELIYDLFKIIYADHDIEDAERKLILKYAIGLGCSNEKAQDVIKKSIKIFSGKLDFEDFHYLINK